MGATNLLLFIKLHRGLPLLNSAHDQSVLLPQLCVPPALSLSRRLSRPHLVLLLLHVLAAEIRHVVVSLVKRVPHFLLRVPGPIQAPLLLRPLPSGGGHLGGGHVRGDGSVGSWTVPWMICSRYLESSKKY